MNQAIKEHQDKCKNILRLANMTESEMIAEFDLVFIDYRAKQEILNELRSDLKHINLDQYAGKTRQIMEKLTKLVAL
jgi:rhodanese-related sulfurtransferase